MKTIRTASHEVAWGVEEEVQLMLERNLLEIPDVETALERAWTQRHEAIDAYRRHVAEHGCLADARTISGRFRGTSAQ